ncbi:nitroreductase family deazaflavin-dependent oxidoreductase [Mycolicibacterium smegmatis]|uniref:nitroreductase family deazaflavin-dependent oxidoreductase n=1 Tax=Mycolicibacterium smegmatis TaxID=1772 RepID=UPI0013039116|nr:nitroreductase family deazaflavin-dependent oxidoreductase [Mycolicibacterium smegmatis]
MLSADERARFNRRVINRIVRPLSGRVAMWSLIEHRGRRSGTVYRTPVTMFGVADGVAILLPYGEDRDWVRNLIAAGGGRAVMNGETFEVTDPHIVPTAEVVPRLARPWRAVVGRLRTPSALMLRRTD